MLNRNLICPHCESQMQRVRKPQNTYRVVIQVAGTPMNGSNVACGAHPGGAAAGVLSG